MADNYLERRMEDLQAGRIAASLKPRKPKREVGSVLIVAAEDKLEEVVRRHRQAGDRTAFLSTNRAMGTALAQKCGARFYPCDKITDEIIRQTVTDLQKHWGVSELKIEE